MPAAPLLVARKHCAFPHVSIVPVLFILPGMFFLSSSLLSQLLSSFTAQLNLAFSVKTSMVSEKEELVGISSLHPVTLAF